MIFFLTMYLYTMLNSKAISARVSSEEDECIYTTILFLYLNLIFISVKPTNTRSIHMALHIWNWLDNKRNIKIKLVLPVGFNICSADEFLNKTLFDDSSYVQCCQTMRAPQF